MSPPVEKGDKNGRQGGGVGGETCESENGLCACACVKKKTVPSFQMEDDFNISI